MVDLNEIKTHLPEEVAERLTPDPREHGKYVCPFCPSGSRPGSTHDGAFSINPDRIHWKCFACDRSGTIIDLVSQLDNISTNEAIQRLKDKYGTSAGSVHRKPEPEPEQLPQDFSEYLEICHADLKDSPGFEYLRRRGLTEETMNRFNLGYGKDLKNQPCIVMPHDRRGTYYTTRAISDTAEKKHLKPAGVKAILFNAAALYQPEPCFIVESQLCAMSIVQQGGSAVALSGTAGKQLLISLLDKQKPSAVLILSLDNDQPGQTAQADLAEQLKERGITFMQYNVAGECKDPNELLQKDPDLLKGSIAAAGEVAAALIKTESEKEREKYLNQTTAAIFPDFEKYLTENAGRPPVPTGFPSLDKILNGGLTAALYIMGAISSLGKTSWMLNIADNIAAAGHDVLYFSLEMSRHELMAKSISRISFQRAGKNGSPLGDTFSTFEVLNSRGKSLTFTQNAALTASMKQYCSTIGQHLWIFSGVGNVSTDDVLQAVDDHIRITGNKPVVFIDYLQILAPEDIHLSDKQNTDRSVVKLKNMSATHDIPVFCISSLNRSNYSEPINMAAFKESGAIEYGSDVLIGLQLYGIGYQPDEKEKDRLKRIRSIIEKAEKEPQTEIEVRVLKNRNGQRGGSGKLLFEKKYNSFADVPSGFTPVYNDTPFEEEQDELPII